MTTATIGAPSHLPTAPRRVQGGLLDPKMLWKSTPDAFRKLNPATLWKNPVMFIVEVGSVWTTCLSISEHTSFAIITTIWLWLTVLFANLAEAVAEGRGKAQAESLRKAKTTTMARLLEGWKPGADPSTLRDQEVAATALQQGQYVVVEAG